MGPARLSLAPAGALDLELAPPRLRLGSAARAAHAEPAAHAAIEGVVGHHPGRCRGLRGAAARAKGKAAAAKGWGGGGGAKAAWSWLLLLLLGACKGKQKQMCGREV